MPEKLMVTCNADCEFEKDENCTKTDLLIRSVMCSQQDYIAYYYARCVDYKRRS